MIKDLDTLRNKIDKIDQNLLELLSKRLSLVAKVGEIKNRAGLFIYVPEREEILIACRRKEAKILGISPDLVEDVLRRIIRESYLNESEQGFKKLCPNLRIVVIIGGQGKVGQFFLKMLVLSGYEVRILDKNDWLNAQTILTDVGMVLISVPIHLVSDVISKLPRLPHDCIVVDLSSVKRVPLKIILDAHSGPVLGLHLMFSPDHGSMVKQVVIYCEGRYPEAYQWLLEQIKLWGAKLYRCSSVEHDQYMSIVQGLCHFVTFVMGYHLFKENIDLKKLLIFSPPIFRLEMITVGRLFAQNPQLYADIIMGPKSNVLLIKRYYKRLGKMLMLLERNNNKQEFIEQFENIKSWFGMYINVFFRESCDLLRQVNDIKE